MLSSKIIAAMYLRLNSYFCLLKEQPCSKIRYTAVSCGSCFSSCITKHDDKCHYVITHNTTDYSAWGPELFPQQYLCQNQWTIFSAYSFGHDLKWITFSIKFKTGISASD